MKSRIFGSVLVFVLLLMVVGVHSTTYAMPEKPDKLSIIALDLDAEQFASAVEIFEEKYGIEVEWIRLPYGQLWGQITTTIMGGATVDLYMMSNSWHPELGKLGMALPIDQLMDEEELAELTANYFDITIEFLSSHGHLWGLPGTATVLLFYYNSAILNELGYTEPPETWDELLQISREAQAAGLAEYGFFPGWIVGEDGMVWFDLMLKLHGGAWMNEEQTEWTFNSEAGVEALTFMKEILDEGIVPRAALEVSDWANMYTFLAGDAVFEISWVFLYGMAVDPEQSEIVDDIEVALIPGIGEVKTYTVLGGGGYAISPTTRSPEWSLELLKYMKGEEGGRGTMDFMYGAENCWKAFYEEPLIHEFPLEDYPLRDAFLQQIEHAGLRPSDYLTWYAEFRSNIFMPAVHRALLGEVGVQEALDQAYEAAQRMLVREGL